MSMKLKLALTSALTCSALIATAAQAQVAETATSANDGALDTIVVTATKTGESGLQETSIAVSVVDGDLMESQNLNSITDFATYVPNLSVSRNISGSILTLRGIGSNGGSESSVATQVDGVYTTSSVAFTEYFDVERVEVLRGPQGTLYGRNTTGGLINIISRQPSSEFSGRARVSYGNYNAVGVSAYVTGPIAGEELTGSLSFTYHKRDAFFENIAPGGKDIDSLHNGGIRGQVRWAPSSTFDATTRIDYFTADQNIESYDHLLAPLPFDAPLANSLVGSFDEVAINAEQSYDLDSGGISEELNWYIADNLTLTSITAWRSHQARAFNDNDASELDILYFRTTQDTNQLSQELNLKYAGDRLKFVGGLYYFNADETPGSRVEIPPSVFAPPNRAAIRGAFPTLESRSIAVFAQADYEFVPNLTLIIGGRYTAEKTSLDQNFIATSLNPATLGANLPPFPIMFSVDRKDNAFTPKFGLNYQASDNVFLYFSATRGFKSGGFNGQATRPDTAGYAPELIWSYEAGAKTEWFDRRLRLNLTGFHYDYTDLQVRQLLGPGNSVIANAASAKVDGVEVELVSLPAPDLQFSVMGSYIDARYESFPTASVPGGFSPFIPDQNCVGPVCTIDASGNFLSDAPEWYNLVAVDYTPTVGNYDVAFHMDYSYRSERFFDPSNVDISRQGGYGLLNANLQISPTSETGWQLGVFARNLTDEDYYQTIAGNGLTPGAIVGAPRTYGVQLGVNW